MKTFESGKFKRRRLWVNDFDVPVYPTANSIESEISVSGNGTTIPKQVVLELSLPRNTSNYATIGFMYTPQHSNRVHLIVDFVNENIEYDKETLASPNDFVYWGIKEEYAQCIFDSASKMISSIPCFPSGKVEFGIGVHSYIGSSQSIFAQATKAVLKLAMLDINSMNDEQLHAAVENVLLD